MATEIRVLDVSYEAAEDLSNDQYRFVVLDSGKVRRPDSGTETSIGVLQNTPVAGAAASVRVIGISKLELGGDVTENDWIKAEYVDAEDAGKGVTAGTTGDIGMGRCLAGGAEGELCEILLSGGVNVI